MAVVATKVLEEVEPSVSVLVLEANFASQDPGEAAEKLLSRIGQLVSSAGLAR
jgi:hypothetical protein